MHQPFTSFYRPWFLVSLVLDSFLWNTNPAGFYLTNLAHYCGVSILIYLFVRVLFGSWTTWRRCLAALLAALLFATNPLHCETLFWVVGRVDVICCFYYMLALLLLYIARPCCVIWALIAFLIALLTKEMAIGLPIAALGLEFVRDTGGGQLPEPAWYRRLTFAARRTWPVWVVVFAYFTLRFVALGKLVGGYEGSFGDALTHTMFDRWTDWGNIYRLFFPFGPAATPYHAPEKLLALLYFIMVALGLFRCSRTACKKMLVFLELWLLSTILPVYQVWGTGTGLENSRYLFFLTVPMSISWAWLVQQPIGSPSNARKYWPLDVIGAVAIILVVCIQMFADFRIERVWIDGGAEVKAVAEECKRLAAAEPGAKFVLLGLPCARNQIHLFYSGEQFQSMMGPPFGKRQFAGEFLSFGPNPIAPSQYMNATRLKEALSDPTVRGPYVWLPNERRFSRRVLRPAAREGCALPVSLIGCRLQNSAIEFQAKGANERKFEISPLEYDFLELQARWKGLAAKSLVITWRGEYGSSRQVYENMPPSDLLVPVHREGNAGFCPIRVRLSDYWSWFAVGRIKAITIAAPGCLTLEAKEARLISGRDQFPEVDCAGLLAANSGFYWLGRDSVPLLVHARVPGARMIELEVTKPDCFFYNPLPGDLHQRLQCILRDSIVDGVMTINHGYFEKPGDYQVRARALASDGRPIGDYSDPLTFFRVPDVYLR